MSEPNLGVIAILERALEDARAGRTQAISLAQVGRLDAHKGKGEWLTWFSWPDDEIELGERLQRTVAIGFSEIETALVLARLEASAPPTSDFPA